MKARFDATITISRLGCEYESAREAAEAACDFAALLIARGEPLRVSVKEISEDAERLEEQTIDVSGPHLKIIGGKGQVEL